MPTRSRFVAVLTADVLHSRRYLFENRQRVDKVLRQGFAEVMKEFPDAIHTPMAFRITAGDEFQCVINDIPKAFDLIYYLRSIAAVAAMDPPLNFRAAVGVGDISLKNKSNPYEEDGPAFVLAREEIDDLQKGRHRHLTGIRTGTEIDMPINVTLRLIDAVSQKWSIFQWEAVKWTLLGKNREEVAGLTGGIAHQNVTKKLLAASWLEVSEGLEFIRNSLKARYS